jgi:hypothetical protein
MTVLSWVFQWFFACHHRDLSRVFTINGHTYQVCFGCGRKIDYSWERMVPLEPNVSASRLAPAESGRQMQRSIN